MDLPHYKIPILSCIHGVSWNHECCLIVYENNDIKDNKENKENNNITKEFLLMVINRVSNKKLKKYARTTEKELTKLINEETSSNLTENIIRKLLK